jgi:mannosyltransferase
MSRHFLAGALMVILAAGAVIRLPSLGEECLSRDEASSWRVSGYEFMPLLWHCAANVHPPGYFLALKGWTAAIGDSPVALRSLSVFLGVAAVGAAFVVASGWGVTPSSAAPHWGAGLMGATFLALAPLQVEISRAARMYPLGVVGAALTTWLLLRALRSSAHAGKWWMMYGVAAAFFCYVHNYAFFTLAGQAIFALGAAIRIARRDSLSHGCSAAARFHFGGAFAAALYAPWLPAFYAQLEEVGAGYWIEPPSGPELLGLLSIWFWGGDVGPIPAALGLGLCAAAAVVVIRKRDALGLCFLAQAAAPWCIAAALSWLGPASILQDRYFSFAQLFLFCLAARAIALSLRGAEQLLAAGALAALLAAGLPARTASQPPSPLASFPEAVRVLAEHYRPGDMVLVARPGDVNLVRYYLKQHGVSEPDVRFPLSNFRGPGHVVHLGSVSGNDILWPEDSPSPTLGRYWRVTAADHSAPRLPPETMERFRYTTRGDTPWDIFLYER